MSEADPDDVEPTGEEAEAQREETVMPWVWAAICVLAVALFLAWAIFWRAPAPQKTHPMQPGVVMLHPKPG